METNSFFKNVRKVPVNENIVEDSEECPQCTSTGQRSLLRFFFVNFDEAVYKCSNASCLYPFGNFKFKNYKDNTVYTYEPIDVIEPSPTDDIPSMSASNQLQPNDTSVFSAKTFTPSQKHDNIEEFDFDFDFGFLENIASDDPLPTQQALLPMPTQSSLPPQPSPLANTSTIAACDTSIDDILNELIRENDDTHTDTKHLETNNQHSLNQFDFVEPQIQPVATKTAVEAAATPAPVDCLSTEQKALTPQISSIAHQQSTNKRLSTAKPKLTKCLETIGKEMKAEKKVSRRRTKNAVATKKTIAATTTATTTPKMEENPLEIGESTKLSEVTKVYSRNFVSTKCLPSAAKQIDVDEQLKSLIREQNKRKPLDLLQQLRNLDVAKANGTLIRRTITKAPIVAAPTPALLPVPLPAAAPATPPAPSSERCEVMPIVSPTKSESNNTPIEIAYYANETDNENQHNGIRSTQALVRTSFSKFCGFDDFGSISYEKSNEEAMGQPLKLDQIAGEEVEIIPVRVDQDCSTFDTEMDGASNVEELDLFGVSHFSPKCVEPDHLSEQIEDASDLGFTETSVDINIDSSKQEEPVVEEIPNQIETEPVVDEIPNQSVPSPKPEGRKKRASVKKLESLDNAAIAKAAKPKTNRKSRARGKQPTPPTKSDECLTDSSITESSIKAPSKRNSKRKPNDNECVVPPAAKRPRKTKQSIVEVSTEIPSDANTSKVTSTRRRVRSSQSDSSALDAIIDSVASGPPAEPSEPVAVADVTTASSRSRKKKTVPVANASKQVPIVAPKQPPKRTRNKKETVCPANQLADGDTPTIQKRRTRRTIATENTISADDSTSDAKTVTTLPST